MTSLESVRSAFDSVGAELGSKDVAQKCESKMRTAAGSFHQKQAQEERGATDKTRPTSRLHAAGITLCQRFGINPVQLSEEWEAFSCNNAGMDASPTLGALGKLESKLVRSNSGKKAATAAAAAAAPATSLVRAGSANGSIGRRVMGRSQKPNTPSSAFGRMSVKTPGSGGVGSAGGAPNSTGAMGGVKVNGGSGASGSGSILRKRGADGLAKSGRASKSVRVDPAVQRLSFQTGGRIASSASTPSSSRWVGVGAVGGGGGRGGG